MAPAVQENLRWPLETLYAEGQRRYIESLSSYARQFLGKAPKPDIEGISNIPPAIAIEQKNSVKTSRSTVGTSTEIVDYLRLLFEKIATATCPTYGFAISKSSPSDATRMALNELNGQRGYILAPVLSAASLSQSKDRLSQDVILKLLLQEGFVRLLIPKDAVFSTKAKPEKTTKKKKSASSPGSASVFNSPGSDYPLCRELIENDAAGLAGLGTVYELKPTDKPSVLPESDFYIVIDRLGFKAEDEARIGDSIAQAYAATLKFNASVTGGRVVLATTDGKRLEYLRSLRAGNAVLLFHNRRRRCSRLILQ